MDLLYRRGVCCIAQTGCELRGLVCALQRTAQLGPVVRTRVAKSLSAEGQPLHTGFARMK
jgi:hypothetical protein